MSSEAKSRADEAAEVLSGANGAMLLTCEHASVRLPDGWAWADEDAWVVGTHWSVDIGGAELTRELAIELGCSAVLARFSRLLCDANRAEGDPSLFRSVAEGRMLALNARLDREEAERRLALYHRPYHATIEAVLAGLAAGEGRACVLSMHTFTPVYEGGQPREIEIGVLYDDEDDLATDFAVGMSDRGLNVWMNEPYSGKDGLIYAALRHARASGRAALELEVRQDLASDPAFRSVAVPAIAAALRDALAGLSE
jgi:predicted N-formylglutamate amidohydrolase